MEKKQIDWENLGFGYVQTEQRYVSNYKDGKWDEGGLTEDASVVRSMNVPESCSMHRLYLKE